MSKIIVVGGGPAGMLASIFAARNGHNVELYEKNDKLGKKLFITGKGRCNITNAADMETLFDNVVTNRKFLYSAFYNFTNADIIELLEGLGVRTKVERGDRVFPLSDKSNDVIRALQGEMNRLGVKMHFQKEVTEVVVEDGVYQGIKVKGEKKVIPSSCLIITTGGYSYQVTGSTGDGYRFAKSMGHKVTDIHPSLVPLVIAESFCKEMMGLSLKNVEVTITSGKKQVYQNFGEMLFTHFGVSGPLILSASSFITKYVTQGKPLSLAIDLKPALSEEQLDDRIIRDFEKNRNKQYKNALDELLPKKMIPVIIRLSNIDPDKKVNTITKEERKVLVSLIKNLSMEITGFRGYNEAIITKGGISVKEVNPSTMESKLVPGVFFAGEVLDLDALTGGFNLQIAWSTGYTAGISVY
ncbi:BaiN/RdsA family NAD(P)/FAD-dependent oxidoreductase [[Clostridium] polysaccharolyticum]|uniref:NAD(P)/FAD-dependent oxidoreductase n=1 Tax=[Clostridium] polysaccharolyticum TaxID=29364 RepID=A0A1I0ADE0_9FIRM|nr:NAD(P)/FAD-dependent oxidoreductase [[Clostridium] polysaccharolyticum]SES92084.1 hypothetical protein SAMN04487772_10588 [[Clostridium] polysaccharolyticum]